MESLLSWYQRKIGAYDLQIWERAVEIREQQDGVMKSMDKRMSSVKPDLIDIDLVRGSTFSKNKPQFSWLVVSCQAFIRVLFLPVFTKWWIQQTSKAITLLFIFLYFLHGIVLFIYLGGTEDQFKFVSPAEVIMPPIIMLLLGGVHCHVVSTNFRLTARGETHRMKKKRTLSSALLEPVVSSSHQSTLSLITSSINKQADSSGYCDNAPSNVSLNTTKDELPVDSQDPADRHDSMETLTKVNGEANGITSMINQPSKLTQENVNALHRRSTTSNSCSNSDNETADLLMHTDANLDSTSTENNSKNGKSRRRRDRLYEELNSTSSGSNSSSGATDTESTSSNDVNKVKENGTKGGRMKHLSATVLLPCSAHGVDRISVKIWESNQCKKIQASLLDIGSIIRRKVQRSYIPNDMFIIGIIFSLFIGSAPTLYRIGYHQSGCFSQNHSANVTVFEKFHSLAGSVFDFTHGKDAGLIVVFVIHAVMLERFLLSFTFFVMLSAAFKTFRQRLLFAKYFSHLTSSRRAKKSDLPHFRLDKVENVRLWLSLRSYLRRRGPQRSVDVIVSSAFFLSLFLLCFISLQLLHDSDLYFSSLLFWEMTIWLLAVAIFLLNFMTIGAQINRKYSNISVLLTEQINLYLQMKQKPAKKEELQRANSVLSIAAKLIKEIEMPFNIYGLAMNPLLYNITRVVVLSAFSGVVSEVLGFKLKIWKIKP